MKKVFLIVATAFALNFASTQMTVASAQTPVDLTYAAEKSVNSVVFIKVTINSKILLKTFSTSDRSVLETQAAEANADNTKLRNDKAQDQASSLAKTVISSQTTT